MSDSPTILDNRFGEAKLELSDGTILAGHSFGARKSVSGEIVFTTGMVGYPESLTDPSYQGQILVLTYPMIGNYGIPDPTAKDKWGLSKYFENADARICVEGIVISEYCEDPNHWQSIMSLHEWLESQGIPGIFMIDTRVIAMKLRDNNGDGMLCKILQNNNNNNATAAKSFATSSPVAAASSAASSSSSPASSPSPQQSSNDTIPFVDPNARILVKEVSTPKKLSFGHGSLRILCLDMGCKQNTIRCFLKYDVTFTLAPYNTVLNEETEEEYDGLFISNGPGNPALYDETVKNLRWALTRDKPIFGICMGNQVMGIAAGAQTRKMHYGNRGQNQPCRDHTTGRVYITSQNHGFVVDTSKMSDEWEPYFTNVNDGTNEGIRHKTKPFFSAQFHPEARCGPEDTEFLFRKFVDEVKAYKARVYTKTPVRSVVVLGAGGIVIAQAGEFDYSGSQCLKSLREEGIRTVLINPNIATVQTEKLMADEVYFCAVTPENVEMVFEKEKPDGILLGWGGQTALNCGLELDRLGILKKHNVRVLGTPATAIRISEDRDLFRQALIEINESCARSIAVTSVSDAVAAAREIGFPVMCRAAMTLGGQGSGICKDEAELRYLAPIALAAAPQLLIEESVFGWKEVEYEVVRDIHGNCITVCNMENFDPMGVHTGESMVVAPSQTLTNDEYHMLRTASIKIIQHLGVIGECNVQLGLHPKSHRYVVIEVNARLSRSSALASKATGYPLAHVAAKLALGHPLHEVRNAVTKTTSACFEPSLDYIVMKVPRWDLNKFNMVSDKLGTMMKSVGEVMAIGRTFEEVIQKALRMVDSSYTGFTPSSGTIAKWNFVEDMLHPTPRRIFAIATALYHGYSTEMIHDLTKIDIWFLTKLQNIISTNRLLHSSYNSHLDKIPRSLMLQAKRQGFSDKQIAALVSSDELKVRQRRYQMDIFPCVKQIDTVSGEFPAQCNYLYVSYNAQRDDITFNDVSYVVLGCGVYRIGNSVEFDYSAVLVTRELRERGHKVLLINHNPETVSTDYDECDRLYFEELSVEVILDILHREKTHGVIVSVGGQVAQNMAMGLKRANVKILGTDASDIDRAEDRNKFSALCDSIKVDQPAWTSVISTTSAHAFADRVGYPIICRPSFVLSGSGMAVIWNPEDVDKYLNTATRISGRHPVVVSKYIEHSLEYDVDCVAHNGKLLCHAVCEHLHEAGTHSGDATMFLPPQKATRETVDRLVDIVASIAKALKVTGPLNVQLLMTPKKEIKVIEANVRSSRSVPFVSKILHTSFPAAMVSAFLGPAHAPFPVSPPGTPDIRGINTKHYEADTPIGKPTVLGEFGTTSAPKILPPSAFPSSVSASAPPAAGSATAPTAPAPNPMPKKSWAFGSMTPPGLANDEQQQKTAKNPASSTGDDDTSTTTSASTNSSPKPTAPPAATTSLSPTLSSSAVAKPVHGTPPLAPATTSCGGTASATSTAGRPSGIAAAASSASNATPLNKPTLDKYIQPDIMTLPFVGCKASMFSFIRLSGADPILGVEMASTGEVGVMGRDAREALFLAMAAQNFKMPPIGGGCLVDVWDKDVAVMLAPSIKKLAAVPLKIYATALAAKVLKEVAGIADVTLVHQPPTTAEFKKLLAKTKNNNSDDVQLDEPNIKTLLGQRKIALTIQVRDKTRDFLLRRMTQSEAPQAYWVRRLSIDFNSSLITEPEIATAFCDAFARFAGKRIDVSSYNKIVAEPLEALVGPRK